MYPLLHHWAARLSDLLQQPIILPNLWQQTGQPMFMFTSTVPSNGRGVMGVSGLGWILIKIVGWLPYRFDVQGSCVQKGVGYDTLTV